MGQLKDGQAHAEAVQAGHGAWGGDQGWAVDEGGRTHQCVVNLGSWMDLGTQRQVGRVLLSLNCVVCVCGPCAHVHVCVHVDVCACVWCMCAPAWWCVCVVYVHVCTCGGVYVVCAPVWGVCVCCVSVCDIVS